MSYIYLASPYSDPSWEILRYRYDQAVRACAMYARLKTPVVSPIVHWHKVAEDYDLPKDHEFWIMQNETLIVPASKFVIFKLDGWEESEGIKWERSVAERFAIPIDELYPEEVHKYWELISRKTLQDLSS